MKNTKTYLAALGAVVIQTVTGIQSASAYDLSTDYSATQNPTGVWSYGGTATLGGAFTLFNNHHSSPGDNGVIVDVWTFSSGSPQIWHNGTGNTVTGDGGQGIYPPGTIELISGGNGVASAFGVARFTVPQGGAGNYLLQTSARNYLNGPSSADSDFHVLDNGAQLFVAQILPSTTAPGTLYSYSANLNLVAGDTIDFVVGRGLDGNGNFSGVNLNASLTLVPEPGTFALAGLGAAAMLLARRRK